MHVEILVPLGIMAMVVLIVWFSHSTRRKANERQAEILRQVIEKFSSGEAFAKSIQGPEGAKLAQALALSNDEPPKKTWTGLFIPASILTLLGIGFFVLYWVENDDLLIPAVVIGAVGFALALSTYVMWRVETRGEDEASDGEGSGSKSLNASANPDTEGL